MLGKTDSISSSSNVTIEAPEPVQKANIPKPIDLLASLQERLHEELKRRVSLSSSKRSISVASYITPLSSAEEVQFWLSSKGFSSKVQQIYQNIKGEELFRLKRAEFEKELGTDEGLRLFNQIALQKNFCGFKTLTSKELNSVLEARRKKIDPDDDFADRRDSADSFATSIGSN